LVTEAAIGQLVTNGTKKEEDSRTIEKRKRIERERERESERKGEEG